MLMTIFAALLCLFGNSAAFVDPRATAISEQVEYKLLAANKTSTMEKEMNQAAAEGYRFEGTMGGETAGGGNEIVVIMSRKAGVTGERYNYRLLATKKTSTMQKEMSEAGAEGFLYSGQSIYNSMFGGREVVVILERADNKKTAYEYKLLATSRTSTMEKELNGAGRDGYIFCGITVAETSFGGREVVSILRRQK